ncbi:unnamed protein product [Sphagnum jensenii]|uniref:Uncharacterized protein n=1 Tax=Sphagnum jensenii TaxID=128206 RepID=A0ABP0WUK0_9BRYO
MLSECIVCYFFKLLMKVVSASEGMAGCSLEDLTCRDKTTALHLKGGGIALILVASALGVAVPLVGRHLQYLKTDGNAFFVCKAFAAGVILATGFVHMLPNAMASLTSPCLPANPWSKYPFAGFIAMLAALGTLVIDFLATEYYQRRHDHSSNMEKGNMPGHAPSHSHSHPEGHHTCNNDANHEHMNGHVGHGHDSLATPDEGLARVRHVAIAQVLELGIVAHSVIIGMTLGVSQSPCTIRPLLGALSFHQFFEGFALGGCISQAGFNYLSATTMACCFALTTPTGIAIGIGISSTYVENSPTALIVEGVFDSVSGGILVYMSLVDLIAADFLSKRMHCNQQLQILSYITLLSGCFAMSALAIWS